MTESTDPPFPDQSFDLIWCEAAIYNIGSEQGLKCWRRLISNGGYVSVSEVTWLTTKAISLTCPFTAVTSLPHH